MADFLIIAVVAIALIFDFVNGFHDAANSIATVVSTGVLKPQQAVLFAAFFNVIAISVFHLSVAKTIGKGIVEPGVVDHHVVFGALIGAITGDPVPIKPAVLVLKNLLSVNEDQRAEFGIKINENIKKTGAAVNYNPVVESFA